MVVIALGRPALLVLFLLFPERVDGLPGTLFRSRSHTPWSHSRSLLDKKDVTLFHAWWIFQGVDWVHQQLVTRKLRLSLRCVSSGAQSLPTRPPPRHQRDYLLRTWSPSLYRSVWEIPPWRDCMHPHSRPWSALHLNCRNVAFTNLYQRRRHPWWRHLKRLPMSSIYCLLVPGGV